MMDKEMIRKTLDAKAQKTAFTIRLCAYIALMTVHTVSAVTLFHDYPNELIKALVPFNLIATISGVGLCAFSAIRYRRILKKAPKFIPVDCYCKESRVKGFMSYFIVELKHENKRITGETNAIFGEYSIHANVGEYIHKWVKAAYDPETGEVLVFQINE